MQNKRFRKENILTLPNLLSLFRILLIPLILWLYCRQKQYVAAVAVTALSGATDMIDGKIARKFNMVSDVGKILDPIADKLTQAALFICLAARYKAMWVLLILFAIKEISMALWGYLTLKYTDTVNSAKWYGKISTAVLYIVMMVLILFQNISKGAADGLIILCGLVMLMSFVLYGRFYGGVLHPALFDQKHLKTASHVLRFVLVLVWGAVILCCFLYRDDLSVEGILNYTPRNPWLAAVIMLLLFALKSLSIIIYSGILYTVNGILFSLPVAIMLNLLGTVIMLSIPYYVGKMTGASAAESIREKYPKAKAIYELRTKNDFFFSYVIRIVRIPSDIASLYMGAIKVDYPKYLTGSLLGMLPHIITYPIMGMSVSNIRSPAFILSFCADRLYCSDHDSICRIPQKEENVKEKNCCCSYFASISFGES